MTDQTEQIIEDTEESDGINIDLKTSLSTDKPVFDVNDKFLPHGNYYFTIRKFTEEILPLEI